MGYELTKDKFLTEKEKKTLQQVLKERAKNKACKRNCLLFELYLATGARLQELLNVTKKDIDAEDQTIFLRGLKGSRSRAIPLKRRLFRRLSAYAKTISTHRIFPISGRRVQQIWDDYKPCNKSIHALRHTVAYDIQRKFRDIKLTQTVLGHRSITNTMIYVDYVMSVEELKRILT